MFRHCKAIAVVPDAVAVLAAAGVSEGAPGVVVAEVGEAVSQLARLLATHRVWDRFGASHGGARTAGATRADGRQA
ncbi:hypothetical protein [Tessaracoccus coleopterorum]|uniref:hypothetical protein n=1 Tax=Tessaracoccus coleopterorum TaxID=2714950 RepID=UPI0022B24B73|nr:hypothetical protein [Tessaracoccus coleopterorum]